MQGSLGLPDLSDPSKYERGEEESIGLRSLRMRIVGRFSG